MSGYTDRGGAKYQKKDWLPLNLAVKTPFIHFGSAPFAPETTGLLLKFSKEICDVRNTRSKKWILAFPAIGEAYSGLYPPNEIMLSKPAQLLWDLDEMPHGFLFEAAPGRTVYTDDATLSAGSEVGFDFDILFSTMLWAQYQRVSKSLARLKDIWNGPVPRSG